MKSILVVDDNKLNLATARSVLSNEYKVIPVMKGQQALTYLENSECDIILLDINMPEMDGFEVLEKIRGMERGRNIPVIFLTADNDAETETRCFKAGAVDFIAKPFVPDVMLSRIGRALELEQLRRSLADRLEQKTREVSAIKSLSQQDALTGLWDRSYTQDAVNHMLKQGSTGALMMIDIDNFKSVNDTYGHAAGDKMLQMLANILREFAEEGDVLCRIGGDEFMVFMKEADSKAQARDRAIDILSKTHYMIDKYGFEVNTSLSIGLALAPEDGTEFTQLYSCADKALYYVKRNGKNSYHFFSDKLRGENDSGQEIVDLKYLQELMHRADSGNGAYFLDMDGFQNVHNFICRFVDRCNFDVSALLFTINGNENVRAAELLEKTICTFLRRSDVAARYSNRQIIVVLMDASIENGNKLAERVLRNFHELYKEEPVHIEYDIVRMENRIIRDISNLSNMD